MDTQVTNRVAAEKPKRRKATRQPGLTIPVRVNLVLEGRKELLEIMRLPAQLTRRGYQVMGFYYVNSDKPAE